MKPLLQLDLKKILISRIPGGKGRYIPGFVYKYLEKVICQDELNAMLRNGYPTEGSEFASRLLEHLDIRLEVEGEENLEGLDRVVFASNHPLGGLDGIALISLLGKRYGDDNIRFLVNDMLMNVEPLRSVFLPINKFGSQGRAAASLIEDAYASGKQMVVFPAGLVSRLHPDGTVHDLEWHKAFAAKALKHGRDIVPIRFVALNRPSFYKLASWRKKLGIGVNLEQIKLPAEVCNTRGKTFRVIIGKPIHYKDLLLSGVSPVEIAARVKEEVYNLAPPEKL